jgi:dipeptidyl aminopeptidase/acylaminoacyl peptidase
VLEDPEFDVVPPVRRLSIDGVPLYDAVTSAAKKALVGVRYVTKGPKVVWFDPDFVGYQNAIDAALPGTVNLFTSMTRDDKKIMVLAFSDRNPGRYYLFDVEKGTLTPMAARMPWIDPEKMAPMHSVQYVARDGLKISAYLTIPLGHPPKNLPLVIMPHGGPWVRDSWEFDPLVQLLANRGYAVLQMNYRGSSGYGEDFADKGDRQIGKGIQDDIEDATRWALKKGLAEPGRIAIVGASYGGYSALFALGKTPELYKCGISIAGVTDWMDILKSRDDEDYSISYEHWVEQLGDPKADAERMRAISPLTFAAEIKAPVLIIQGEDDRIVPEKQARRMISALEKAGQKPESLFLPEEGHNFAGQKGRIQMFKKIESFLLKHLGPGVTPVVPPAAAKMPAKT